MYNVILLIANHHHGTCTYIVCSAKPTYSNKGKLSVLTVHAHILVTHSKSGAYLAFHAFRANPLSLARYVQLLIYRLVLWSGPQFSATTDRIDEFHRNCKSKWKFAEFYTIIL